MEIISYMLDGALRHEDSMGTGSVINVGDVQRMSAGTGVLHSERNASDTRPAHFLQIWLLPDRNRLPPSYEQRTFPLADRRGRLTLVASRDRRDGSLAIHQDADLFSAILGPRQHVRHEMKPGRHAWIQVARGDVTLNHEEMHAGDGASASDEAALELVASTDAEVLLFDLA
jgi:redox-sensitive bicupin YhaK (pirin superfamily)